MRSGKRYGVGYRKPPKGSRFKPGKSGNPKGRPKGSKNFATVIEQELNGRVPINENGQRRSVSKRQVIAKQMVNKAAGGDLKAAQTLLSQERLRDEDQSQVTASLDVFDTPNHVLVIAEIVRRIRAMDPPVGIVTPNAIGNAPVEEPNE